MTLLFKQVISSSNLNNRSEVSSRANWKGNLGHVVIKNRFDDFIEPGAAVAAALFSTSRAGEKKGTINRMLSTSRLLHIWGGQFLLLWPITFLGLHGLYYIQPVQIKSILNGGGGVYISHSILVY